MKHLNRYESFFKIREGLEKGLEKFIHLKDLLRSVGKTEADDLAKSLTKLVDNVGDDAANKLEQLMGRVIRGKNVTNEIPVKKNTGKNVTKEIPGKKIDRGYWIISKSNATMRLELLYELIEAVSTGKRTFDEIAYLLPDELLDGIKLRTEMKEILKKVKPKPKTTPSPEVKPEVKEDGSIPTPKTDTDVLIGQKKLPLSTEQIEQTFQDQQDVYDKLRNLQDWNRLKGVFEKVDDKQDVLSQLEKIGFGPGSAVRSKAFIEAIGEKNLVNFWNDMVNMRDSFKEMSQSDLMKLIEERMSRLESKSLGVSDKDKKGTLSKLKFPDRKRRAAIFKWAKYTIILGATSFWLYKTFVEDKKEESPESKGTGEENTNQSTEQQTGGESSNTEQKKTSRKSKEKSLPKFIRENPKLSEPEPVNPVDAGDFDDMEEDTTIKDLGTSTERKF